MKKLVSILLAVVFCLSFAACARNQAKPETDDVYLTLVNKTHKLPDNWEDMITLVDTQNDNLDGIELTEDSDYLKTDTFKVEKKTLEAFRALQKDLAEDGIIIFIDSTYRSVERQQEIWDEFEAEKGLDYAKKYVAVPGYSEHHTGLVIDICIAKDGKAINDNDEMIAEKEIFSKIHAKLAEYGFILRYLDGKDDITGYAYEPWHLRYVGSPEIAKEIMDKGITFEEYLGETE